MLNPLLMAIRRPIYTEYLAFSIDWHFLFQYTSRSISLPDTSQSTGRLSANSRNTSDSKFPPRPKASACSDSFQMIKRFRSVCLMDDFLLVESWSDPDGGNLPFSANLKNHTPSVLARPLSSKDLNLGRYLLTNPRLSSRIRVIMKISQIICNKWSLSYNNIPRVATMATLAATFVTAFASPVGGFDNLQKKADWSKPFLEMIATQRTIMPANSHDYQDLFFFPLSLFLSLFINPAH